MTEAPVHGSEQFHEFYAGGEIVAVSNLSLSDSFCHVLTCCYLFNICSVKLVTQFLII